MRSTPVPAATTFDLRTELARLNADSFAWALRSCGGDRTEGEEVLHVAYMKVLDGTARFEGRSTFKTWLFAVIRRTAQEQRRTRWLRHLRLERWWQRDVRFESADAATSERTVELTNALTTLSTRQQQVLHLVFYQDLTIEEAAEILGMPVGTARTHYARGKDRLRAILRTDGTGE